MMGDDDPYQTDERGIADLGSMLIAWFRDPDNRVIRAMAAEGMR